MISRPKRSRSLQIGVDAELEVDKLFNKLNWSSVPFVGKEDLGLDRYVTICQTEPPGETSAISFVAQIKGTTSIKSSKEVFSHSIKKEKIPYWMERALPVLFLLVDVVTKKIYWQWGNLDELKNKALSSTRKTIQIKIPRSNCLTVESSDVIKRIAGRMVWPVVRKKLRSPTELRESERKNIFPFMLQDLPYPFIDIENKKYDVLVITGPARYELENVVCRFDKLANTFFDKQLGNEIILGESTYNLSAVSEVLSALSLYAGKLSIDFPRHNICLPYIAVTEDLLCKHNIICISCGDVNPILPQLHCDFEMKYLVRSPIHHQPYETSESLRCEVTNMSFEKLREDQWAGYLCMLPNPWNSKKAVLICGGNKGVGTQAALLFLRDLILGRRKSKGRKGFPAEIVIAHFNDTLLTTGYRLFNISDVKL